MGYEVTQSSLNASRLNINHLNEITFAKNSPLHCESGYQKESIILILFDNGSQMLIADWPSKCPHGGVPVINVVTLTDRH